MAITPLDIAKMALAVLDEAPIDSLDQDVKAARLLNLHFDLAREAELTKHAWVFAILAASVAGADTGSGDCTLSFAYDLPADCLRPLRRTAGSSPVTTRVTCIGSTRLLARSLLALPLGRCVSVMRPSSPGTWCWS